MKLVIVGAGAAGARVAQGLVQSSHDVTIVEARDRIGGRLLTREVEGARWEAGGEWIDADHTRIFASLREQGLAPVPVLDRRQIVEFEDGRSETDGDEVPAAWVDAGLDAQSVADARDQFLLDLDLPPWHNVLAFDLDQMTLGAWLDRTCQTRRGRWLQEARRRSDEGDATDQVGLLAWLIGQLTYDERTDQAMSAYRFPEGAQRWCERMVEASGATVRLKWPVTRIERTGESFLVYGPDGVLPADRVVLTAPPPALRAIEFDPEISGAKRAAWDELRLSRTVKLALRFRRPPWGADSGSVLTHRPTQQWWAADSPEHPVLLAYVTGPDAEALRTCADPIAQFLHEVTEVWPSARNEFIAGEVHDWIADPHAGGGFACLPPNYVLGSWEDLMRPEAGFHFAGEACAIRNGFIEGALESAERVLTELGATPNSP